MRSSTKGGRRCPKRPPTQCVKARGRSADRCRNATIRRWCPGKHERAEYIFLFALKVCLCVCMCVSPKPNQSSPGSYTFRQRKIVRNYSFGGRTCLAPAVRCQPPSPEVCSVCKTIPKGIHWKHMKLGRIMCRYCKPIRQRETRNGNVLKQIEMNEYTVCAFCRSQLIKLTIDCNHLDPP